MEVPHPERAQGSGRLGRAGAMPLLPETLAASTAGATLAGLPAHLLDELVDFGSPALHLGDLAHAARSRHAQFACGKSGRRVTHGTEPTTAVIGAGIESALWFGVFLMLS